MIIMRQKLLESDNKLTLYADSDRSHKQWKHDWR
jgi:hypothetical protein